LEHWSIEKMISGCEDFHEPSLYNASIRDEVVVPALQHSITPILHKPFKLQETKSPLGITKAGSLGLGSLLFNLFFSHDSSTLGSQQREDVDMKRVHL
jgi:hypothetical protein